MLLLTGCERDSVFKLVGYDQSILFRWSVSREEEDFARGVIEGLRHQRYDQYSSDLDLNNPETAEKLAAIRNLFPPHEPVSLKLVDVRTVRRGASRIYTLSFEYDFGAVASNPEATRPGRGRWLLAQVLLETEGNRASIGHIDVGVIAKPIEEVNAFTLKGKTGFQYLFLLLTVATEAFSFYAFVRCLRTRPLRRKWIWAIIALLGICKLTVNWTTGLTLFTPIAFSLPPALFSFSAYGPWMVHLHLPLGAVIFLLRRKSLIAAAVMERERKMCLANATGLPNETLDGGQSGSLA